jgi:catechol 2,3-dioxygenase-like lactoylglutathione lyase family enzyme
VLPAPGFHHLHLNSVDPRAAIDFYVRQFPTSTKTRWAGLPALAAPNDVLVLFSQVATPPPTSPQTAIWHFGWHVPDTRASLAAYQARPDLELLPLYISDDVGDDVGSEGGAVFVSSDTWPSKGPTPGLTKAQIAEARATGVQPTRTGGFAYMRGPDQALVEYAGNHPAERFNHVHLYQNDPFCAQLWYQTHLNARVYAGRTSQVPLTESTCTVPRGPDRSWPALDRGGMFRAPSAAVVFGDVALPWYVRQGDRPLASTRGQLYDHLALSVTDLDAWVVKLRGEGVRFLEEPYSLGDTRAVMIEGPSREALELVEIS